MTGRLPTTGLILGILGLAAPAAAIQGLAAPDETRAELLGTLTFTRLSVRFDDAPAREAFRALSRAAGTPIAARFVSEKIDHGIDPEIPIALAVDDVDALLVLEMILEQCEEYDPCTWQLRNGYIEVGTKERLSAPAAAETRMYPIRDLMLEPPYFVSPGAAMPSAAEFYAHDYACAAITRPASSGRKSPHELAQEMVEAIVETIEPGNWDYGQFVEEARNDDGRVDTRRARRTQPGLQKIARIRLIGDRIVITAPDFIHRQVNGYPRPIRPPKLTPEELQQRSQMASTERAHVVVLGSAPAPGRRTTP